MNGPSIALGVGLLLLNLGSTIPLEFGTISLILPVSFWLSCLWGGAAAAVAVALSLLLRRRPWREVLCDLPSACLVCLAVHLCPEPLESPLMLTVLLLASVPLTLILRMALAPKKMPQGDFVNLLFEAIGLALLGPLAVGLYQRWPLGLLALPCVLLGLLSSVRKETRLRQLLGQRGEAQISPQQRNEVEARAEAFQMLEALSLQCRTRQQAVEAILGLMSQRFPGCYCAYLVGNQVLGRRGIEQADQSHRMQWNVTPDSTLVVSFRSSVAPAAQQSLGVFVRCSAVMLERADFQESLLRSVQALRYLLAATQELAPGLPADHLRQRAYQVASHVMEGRPLQISPQGALLVSDGFPVAAYQQEAMQLLEQLLQSAIQRGQQQAQLSQSSKLAAIGQLAAGVAHELNTPLGSLTVLLGGIQQSLTSRPERAAQRLEQAQKAIQQMKSIVSKLLYYGRETGQGRRQVNLETILQDTLELTAHTRSGKGIQVQSQSIPAEVEVDPGEIQQVISNLLVNAALALESGSGTIRVLLGQEQQEAVLQVEDSGPGVDPEIAERIFEPFFTTRPVGQGTGLGLSISRQIAEQNGGRLDFLGGSRFQLRLPLWKSRAAAVG